MIKMPRLSGLNGFGARSLLISSLILGYSIDGNAQGLYALSWSAPKNSYPYIYPMVWATPTTAPLVVKSAVDKLPQGKRTIFFNSGQRGVIGQPGDKCVDPQSGASTDYNCPWLVNGVAVTKTIFQDFFSKYYSSGGSLDNVVLDSEIGLGKWQLAPSAQLSDALDAIENDARFTPNLLPALGGLVLNSGQPPLSFIPLNKLTNNGNREEILAWNELMSQWVGKALDESVFIPLQTFYPNASMSDYGHFEHNPVYPVWDLNGWEISKYGTGFQEGSHSAPSLYGRLVNISYASLSPTGVEYAKTPFNALRYDVNTYRAIFLGTQFTNNRKTVHLTPWVPYRGFSGSLYENNDMYQEMIFHIALTGPDWFLAWNPEQADKNTDDDAILNNTLAEVNEVVGDRQHTLVTEVASWTDDYIITTTSTRTGKISRFTPYPAVVNTCYEDSNNVICKVGSSGILFANARILTVTNPVSNAGYWIRQARNAPKPQVFTP